MKKLDESQIIEKFQKIFGNRNFVSEDVEFFKLGKENIVAKVDTLVQSTDIPPKMKLKDAARKSVVACVSDFAAKGVRPKFAIVSVNLTSNSTGVIGDIAKGFKTASKEFGFQFLGGDTNAGKEVVFNVCMFGTAKNILARKGAKKGDLIFVTGPFGYSSAGLKILLKKIKSRGSFYSKATKAVLRPESRLSFGIKNKNYCSSAMDSSDGLSTTLLEMAKQSKCKFVINKIPFDENLAKFCKDFKQNLHTITFHGGEEYEIVFTAPKKNKKHIFKNAKVTKTPIIEIGYVSEGKGVFIQGDKKEIPLKDLGWHHFKKNIKG